MFLPVRSSTPTTVEERQEFLRLFDRIAERVPIVHIVRACRDPKDDKFLELAVNVRPTDNHRRHEPARPNPFRGIDILTAASYLTR